MVELFFLRNGSHRHFSVKTNFLIPHLYVTVVSSGTDPSLRVISLHFRIAWIVSSNDAFLRLANTHDVRLAGVLKQRRQFITLHRKLGSVSSLRPSAHLPRLLLPNVGVAAYLRLIAELPHLGLIQLLQFLQLILPKITEHNIVLLRYKIETILTIWNIIGFILGCKRLFTCPVILSGLKLACIQ